MCRKYVLIIFMTFISILLLNTSEVSATFDFDYNGNFYSLPDLPPISENFDGQHFSIYNNGNNLLTYINYTDACTPWTSNETNGDFGVWNNNGEQNCYVKIWNNNGTSWVLNSWQPNSTSFGYYSGEFSASNFIFSTVDIYLGGTSNILFPSSELITTPFIEPSLFPNASENEEQQKNLTSGQFTFFIVNPRFYK